MKTPTRRRGTIIVLTMVMLLVILGFAGLTIDIGHACALKTNMQKAADAAALAGVAVMLNDDDLKDHYDPEADVLNDIHNSAEITARVQAMASTYTTHNDRGKPLEICSGDLIIGHISNPDDMTQSIDPSGSVNAVEVTLRRSEQCNGEMPTILGRLFGLDTMDLQVSAMAYREDNYAGFSPPEGTSPLLPFTVHVDYYEEQLLSGPDDWHWSDLPRGPALGADSISEVWIYPKKAKSTDGIEDEGGGNFGTLAIGDVGLGSSALGAQIEAGVSDEDLMNELGTDVLTFTDDNGDAQSYPIGGNPGISAGISESIESRVGDVVAFFVHDDIVASGSNGTYNIVDIRYGILMEVTLNGNPNDKRIVIQPTVYNGPGIVFDDDAPSTGGLVSRVKLIR